MFSNIYSVATLTTISMINSKWLVRCDMNYCRPKEKLNDSISFPPLFDFALIAVYTSTELK